MKRRIKSLVVALVIAGLFSALGVGVVLARGGGDGDRESHGVTEEEKQAKAEEARTEFAEALGVTLEELDAAFQQVALDRVDAAEADGTIDADQATELRTAIESGEFAGKRFGRGFRGAGSDGATALAEELEVTVDDLAAARKQVALNRVDGAVEAGKITEEQAEEIRAKIEAGEGREHGRGHHGFGKRGGKHFDASHDKDKDGDSITEETATTE